MTGSLSAPRGTDCAETDRQTDETCICTNIQTTKMISKRRRVCGCGGGINGLISKINKEQHFCV